MAEVTPTPENRVDTSDSPTPVESHRGSEGPAVLVIAGLGNSGKVERHLGPLAAVASETTVVCVREGPEIEGITYREAPTFGSVWGPGRLPGVSERLVGIVAMLFVALIEALRGDYDAVASISLVPYGYFALVVGHIARLPTHLGIIGADLDLHATAWYGPLVRAAFRRFTAVSVPGNDHQRRLVRMGVAPDRISILANAVDADRYRPGAGYRPEAGDRPETGRESAVQEAPAGPTEGSAEYDVLWVGRFSPEKDPLLFVRTLGELADRGVAFEAAMVGSGSLELDVRRERAAHGLVDQLDLPGWVDDPLPYYGCSSTFVLTSEREGLPLSLLEAMAVGIAPVVPDIGSVTDVAVDGETAVVVDERTPEAFADALERLLTDDGFRAEIADETPTIRDSYSYAAARDDWRHILATMGCLDRHPSQLENGPVS